MNDRPPPSADDARYPDPPWTGRALAVVPYPAVVMMLYVGQGSFLTFVHWLSTIVVLHVVTAVLIALDMGRLRPSRGRGAAAAYESLLWAAAAVVCHEVVYPVYMWHRPAINPKASRYLATAIIGVALFVCTAVLIAVNETQAGSLPLR
jgi:peptidoglycan/LPS O-acetylase OafA/YrhL